MISGILLLERVDNAMDTAVSPDARLAMTQLLRYLTQSLVQWIAVI